MKKLLVISNEGIDSWPDKMKEGWDEIKVISSPKIPYGATETWILDKANEFVMNYIGMDSENEEYEYVYLCPNDLSMVFYNRILHWRFRRTQFIDPLFIPVVDQQTLEYTGERRFVRWLDVKRIYER